MLPAWPLVIAIATAPDDVLRWSAPAQCPDATLVRALVEQQLDRPLAETGVAIDGRIEPITGASYELVLAVTQAGLRHERVLVARECHALARGAALVIALGIDAVAVAEHVHPQLVPEPELLPPPAAREPASAPQGDRTPASTETGALPRPRRPSWAPQLVLALVGGFERGALPGITGAVDGAIGLRGRGFRVELAGTWLGPREHRTELANVRVQLGAVALRGCPELAGRRASFPLCVGVELGAMRGAGSNTDGAQTRHGLWVAPTISPGLRVGAGRFAFVARGEVAIAAQRPSFELRGSGEPIAVYVPPPVSARLWLGVEFRVGGRDGTRASRRNSGVRRG